MCISDAMGPNKLLCNGSVRDVAQVSQEGTLFEVDVHTITEAVMAFAREGILIHAERELWLSSTSFEALK